MPTDKLAGVHPALIRKIGMVLDALKAIGYGTLVTQGVRTADYQHSLWLQGRDGKGGKIVTNCDGFTTKSNHQVKSDGLGYAVDIAFLDANGVPSWDDHYPWAAYGALGEALGLVWGGRFTTIKDSAHLELKAVV